MCALINILINIPVHVTSLAKVFIQSVENRVLLTLGLHRWTCTSYVYGINLSNEGKNDKTFMSVQTKFYYNCKKCNITQTKIWGRNVTRNRKTLEVSYFLGNTCK